VLLARERLVIPIFYNKKNEHEAGGVLAPASCDVSPEQVRGER